MAQGQNSNSFVALSTKKDLNFDKKKETSQKMNPVCFVD